MWVSTTLTPAIRKPLRAWLREYNNVQHLQPLIVTPSYPPDSGSKPPYHSLALRNHYFVGGHTIMQGTVHAVAGFLRPSLATSVATLGQTVFMR